MFIPTNNYTNITVGCGKVNCGIAAREGALGHDLGAPYGKAFYHVNY